MRGLGINLRNRTIHSMVYNAMKMFMEINPQFFDECSQDYTEMQNTAEARERQRQQRWERLTQMANARKNNAEIPGDPATSMDSQSRTTETDAVTQDSQQRLNALKIQDDTDATKERRLGEREGHNPVSVLQQN